MIKLKNIFEDVINSDKFIYHGTSKGATLSIQRDGDMKPSKTGEQQPSISFSNNLDYASYYAKAKGGTTNSVVLKTKLTSDFILSPRINKNNGVEYVTFKPLKTSDLEFLSKKYGWVKLDDWNVIFDEPNKKHD